MRIDQLESVSFSVGEFYVATLGSLIDDGSGDMFLGGSLSINMYSSGYSFPYIQTSPLNVYGLPSSATATSGDFYYYSSGGKKYVCVV